jgi:hypothetical protein
MGRLEIRIQLVERVTEPIRFEIDGLALESFRRRNAPACGRPIAYS